MKLQPPEPRPAAPRAARRFVSWLQGLAVAVAAAALAATVALVVAEDSWGRYELRDDPEGAFARGSIGTEFVPLPVFEVLPDLFSAEPHHYFKPRPGGGDWVAQYGFIRDPKGPLPVGLTARNLRPESAAPSPVPFVGFACAACHSQEIRLERDGPAKLVLGVGNPNLNLLAFGEAFRGAMMAREGGPDSPYVLRLDTIDAAQQARRGRGLSTAERAIVYLWLRGARAGELEFEKQVDDPFLPGQVLDPKFVPAGPLRTQPFRSLVRIVLERPGSSAVANEPDRGFSQIPAAFHQDHRFHGKWAQFDGSVSSLNARSALAAMTAGATVDSLATPEIAHNIKQAAEYTRSAHAPAWADVGFLPAVDAEKAGRGADVYGRHCFGCHGGPGPDGRAAWRPGKEGVFGRNHDVGTDPERVNFRHKDELAGLLYHRFADFRKDHPLAFPADEIRAPDQTKEDERGYYAGPIGGAYTRAPYLHNASVLTLAELIHLRPRRDVFYRGTHLFDPQGVGLKAPAQADEFHYFRFDARERGNSNRGHDYPWKPRPEGWTDDQRRDLEDLLEYLKTI